MKAEVRVRERFIDATLLALVAEEEATSQGMQAAPGSRIGQESGFSPSATRRNVAWRHLDLSPVRPFFGLLTSRL